MAGLPVILVVEDDETVRSLLVRMLAGKGFGVLAAADGYEATRILVERHVDVLLTDIVMPSLDGVQLARQAKLMRPRIKVLFATGYAARASEREAIRLGPVLFKPVREPEVIQAIKTLTVA